MRRLPIFCILLAGLAMIAGAADKPHVLTLQEARATALKKHPRITVADLKLLAAQQSVRQAQSALLPTVTGSFSGAGATQDNTRIASSPLTLSSVFDRISASVLVTQLVTDFGRTVHLTRSSKLKASAEERNGEAVRALLLLQVDSAYFGALEAKALLEVAGDTMLTRRLLRDQIVTLMKNQLKSELDASFAEVSYQEALLLESTAQNDLQSSYASLAALLGQPRTASFRLAGPPAPGSLPETVGPLMSRAVANRPDLQRLRFEHGSAAEFALAEAALNRPTLSVQGTAGLIPWGDNSLNHDYAAAGFVMSIPFFSGGLNTARRMEAEFRMQAVGAALRDEENNAMRDVRLAWLAAKNAQDRAEITGKLVVQARRSLSLAQARYDTGASSIVELSQAQLSLTSAQITHTNARYEYLIRRSLLDYQTGTLR
jgi:outer membrane protein